MKKWIYGVLALAILIVLWVLLGEDPASENTNIFVQPERGDFRVSVVATGELRAKTSIEIRVPTIPGMRRHWRTTISDIIAEGSEVEEGQYVAKLDDSDMRNNIEDTKITLDKLLAQLKQAELDSSLTLSKARNDIVDLRFNLEARKLEVDQSKFEPPAIQRQAEIAFDKAQRALNQATQNYDTIVQKAIEKIRVVDADLNKEKNQLKIYKEVLGNYTIHAPADGMLVYSREWNGKKKVVGSNVHSWNPTVATLPDLSVMESVTYVNEVDIQKVKTGHEVLLTLDALPDKKLHGTVTQVANVGEKAANSDSKVFEVIILVAESDSTLRPSMTTSNEIVTEQFSETMSIPLECVHSEDSTVFVYKSTMSSMVKQEILQGAINENRAQILQGLSLDDEVAITVPDNSDDLPYKSLKP